MLEVADVCILCGEVHPARHFGLSHGERGECPRVLMGRFPLISLPDGDREFEEDVLRGSASRRIREYETPTPLPPSRRDLDPDLGVGPTARNRAIGMPWLPLPDLGEVI